MREAHPNHRQYLAPRARKNPPHLSIRSLRELLGMTQEDVCARVNDYIPGANVVRGTISAIESGSKGVSAAMLEALEYAYGMPKGSLVTDYVPRRSRADVEAVAS